MNEILILETQRKLEKLNHPTPLAIAKEIVTFSKGNKTQIKKIIKRLSHDEPWEYIRGYTYFNNNKIFVNKNVLIPRVETEDIVNIAKNHIKNDYQIFDIGTGSGCIAIALSKIFKNNIFAIDIDKKALNVAKKNIEINNCKNIKLINANLLNFDFDNKIPTIIVANLPYLSTKNIEKLQHSVKDYEPISALESGEKGYELYVKLLEQIKSKNVNIKYGVFEIDPNISKYFEEKNFDIHKDCFGRKRFAIIPPTLLK